MRRRFKASLTNNGCIVHTCEDGLKALTWLQTNLNPDLMTTDVEMPNMDGFTSIDRCRQDYVNFPMLVVSLIYKSGVRKYIVWRQVTISIKVSSPRNYSKKLILYYYKSEV